MFNGSLTGTGRSYTLLSIIICLEEIHRSWINLLSFSALILKPALGGFGDCDGTWFCIEQSFVLNKFHCIICKTQCVFIHNSNIPVLSSIPLLVLVLYSVTISVLSVHFQAWLTEIHEYAQQDVVVMLLGNKVRNFLPMWADVWTDGLRGGEKGGIMVLV